MTHRYSFICTKCFDVKDVDIRVKFKDGIKFYSFTNDLNLNFKCSNCKKYLTHFYVDRKIANTISLLNKIGYSTMFSCEGHMYLEYNINKEEINIGCNCPYVYLRTNKKQLSKEMIKDLIKLGFNVFDLKEFENKQQMKHFRNLKVTDEDAIKEISENDIAVSIYYDIEQLSVRYSKCEPKEAIKKAKRYLNDLHKRLYETLLKYYKGN